jgi:hypothetical protein
MTRSETEINVRRGYPSQLRNLGTGPQTEIEEARRRFYTAETVPDPHTYRAASFFALAASSPLRAASKFG